MKPINTVTNFKTSRLRAEGGVVIGQRIARTDVLYISWGLAPYSVRPVR